MDRNEQIKQAATAHADAKEKAADCGTEFSTPELADAEAAVGYDMYVKEKRVVKTYK